MAQSKLSDTTVVQELLAFVQNKLDVMDEVSLEQICTSSFTDEDILAAKKVLSDTVTTACRLITRRRDRDGTTGKKDLQDIFRVLKVTDPDDVPTYVARDLNRLPPVTWDHVDVTRFMKDIVQLRAEVTDIRKKLEESEKNVADLNKELVTLKTVAKPTITPTSSQNNNVGRVCDRCNISSVSASASATTRNIVTQVNDRNTRANPVTKNTTSQPVLPAPSSSVRPAPPPKSQKNYAQASCSSPASAPVAEKKRTKPTPAPVEKKVDNDGFTLVERRKRRQRNHNPNKRGTASTSTALKVVEPTFSLYLSRVDPSTSGEEVLKYVHMKLGDASSVFHLARLESSVRTPNFKSYTLRVPAKHKTALLSPSFWPSGLVFRRYWEASQLRKIPDKIC